MVVTLDTHWKQYTVIEFFVSGRRNAANIHRSLGKFYGNAEVDARTLKDRLIAIPETKKKLIIVTGSSVEGQLLRSIRIMTIILMLSLEITRMIIAKNM